MDGKSENSANADENANNDESKKVKTKPKQIVKTPYSTTQGQGGRKITIAMEATKDMIKQIKTLKTERRTTMDGRHIYVLSRLADAVPLEQSAVEEFILGDENYDSLTSFFEANGNRSLTFYYQEVANFHRGDLAPQLQVMPKKLIIGSGSNEPLTGTCYMFVRGSNSKPITPQTVAQDVNFMMMDCSKGKLLEGLESVFQHVFVPSLDACEDWGRLKEHSKSANAEFVETLGKFVGILSTARENMAGRVLLDAGDLERTLGGMRTPSEYVQAGNNSDLLEQIEGLVAVWTKQIEQVLAESEQMRKEADDIGPSAELDHWRKRMAKFNSLLDQLKSPHCKSAIGILYAARSKSLRYWRELDGRITDAANEAKDNVKYLYTLDKENGKIQQVPFDCLQFHFLMFIIDFIISFFI